MKTAALYRIAFGLLFVGLLISSFSYGNHQQAAIDSLKKRNATLTSQLQEVRAQRCSSTQQLSPDALEHHSLQRPEGDRTFYTHTPKEYSYNTRTPLVIAYDGKHGSAERIMHYSELSELPAIVVYPEPRIGTDGVTAWQGAPYAAPGVDDVSFTTDIIEYMRTKYCIDASSIFTVGMSNGATIAWLAACHLPDTIAATVGVSGAYYSDCPDARQPISALFIHSLDDQLVPYSGDPIRRLPAVPTWAQMQADRDNCYGTPMQLDLATMQLTSWSLCDDDSAVQLITVRGEQHGWLYIPARESNTAQQPLSYYIWQFLSSQ